MFIFREKRSETSPHAFLLAFSNSYFERWQTNRPGKCFVKFKSTINLTENKISF